VLSRLNLPTPAPNAKPGTGEVVAFK